MTIGLLVVGIGLLLVGLLAIGFGIPVKEFSFGNTLILTGVVTACTGVISIGLWAAVRELKLIAGRLGQALPSGRSLSPWPVPGATQDAASLAETEGAADLPNFAPAAPTSRPDELTWDRDRPAAQPEALAPPPPAPEAPAATRPRRNLLRKQSRKTRPSSSHPESRRAARGPARTLRPQSE